MANLIRIAGVAIVPGRARGKTLIANVALSFWGGFDPDSGRILDQRHPLAGSLATGRILVMPAGRGSCSGSGVLLEAIRNGTAPAGIILSRIDPIIALGAILGDELLGAHLAVIVVSEESRPLIPADTMVTIDEDGTVTVASRDSGADSDQAWSGD